MMCETMTAGRWGHVMTTRLGPSPPSTSPVTHRVMLSNRGKNTNLEVNLRKAIRLRGIKGYRVNYRINRSRVDVAFPSRKVAVQIHGCFWHHCPDCNLPLPKTHTDFWRRKFSLNRRRDRNVRSNLRRDGWRVVEIWEHEVRKNPARCLGRIQVALKSKRDAH
jgi:DNA mismatch endonuclease (patch repair protein)